MRIAINDEHHLFRRAHDQSPQLMRPRQLRGAGRSGALFKCGIEYSRIRPAAFETGRLLFARGRSGENCAVHSLGAKNINVIELGKLPGCECLGRIKNHVLRIVNNHIDAALRELPVTIAILVFALVMKYLLHA